jgi:acetylornithine/LysW-gamma-L-lysine aminotransferase
MGALATTWKDKYKKPYEPLMGDVEFVPYDEPDAMAEAVDDETAAVIVEPVQGEGGINPASKEFLQTARVETATSGAALIFDEVQTGLGRTGSLWASEWTDVVPDMITSAKGLGNGLPVGATLCRDWIAEDYGSHASTFSGGPVISAAAHATVSTLVNEDVPGHAAEVGEYLREGLREELGDAAREVRGEGLMIGIEVKRGANRILRDLALEQQLLALPAGRTVVRLLPPLTLSKAEADEAIAALGEVIG